MVSEMGLIHSEPTSSYWWPGDPRAAQPAAIRYRNTAGHVTGIADYLEDIDRDGFAPVLMADQGIDPIRFVVYTKAVHQRGGSPIHADHIHCDAVAT